MWQWASQDAQGIRSLCHGKTYGQREERLFFGTWTPFLSHCCCHGHVCITHHCRNIWFTAEPAWLSRLMHLSFISRVTGGKNFTVPGYSYVDFHLLQTSMLTFFTQSRFHDQKSWQCHRPGFSWNENCLRGRTGENRYQSQTWMH